MEKPIPTQTGSPHSGRVALAAVARRAPLWLYWLLPLGWMAVIFVLSAQPNFDFVPDAWTAEPVSMAAHFTEYAVLAGLLSLAAARTAGLRSHAAVFALAAALLYAASDEWHQTFVPGRVADVRDLAADALGVLLAIWITSHRRAGKGHVQAGPTSSARR